MELDPPMKRKMMLLPWDAPTSSTATSGARTGKMISGRRAVAGIGMASVIHHTPMRAAVAAVSLACWARSEGMRK